MPKTKQQKQATIESLVEGLKQAKAAVFANFQGLKVSESEELRRECRKNNVGFIAAKKTLVKKACEEAGLEGVNPKEYTSGVATFMAFGDEVSAARVVADFAKKHDVVTIYGGILEGKMVDAASVKALANLPSREQLLSRLVGSINAPVSGFVNVLAGNLRNLVGVLNNIKEAKV